MKRLPTHQQFFQNVLKGNFSFFLTRNIRGSYNIASNENSGECKNEDAFSSSAFLFAGKTIALYILHVIY